MRTKTMSNQSNISQRELKEQNQLTKKQWQQTKTKEECMYVCIKSAILAMRTFLSQIEPISLLNQSDKSKLSVSEKLIWLATWWRWTRPSSIT